VKIAVLKEEFPIKDSKKEPESVVELLAEFYNYACKCDEEEISSAELQYLTVKLLDTNCILNMCKASRVLTIFKQKTVVFYYIFPGKAFAERNR